MCKPIRELRQGVLCVVAYVGAEVEDLSRASAGV